MTIKDVQFAVAETQVEQSGVLSRNDNILGVWRAGYLASRLFYKVLTAIANSTCQDSPAELAAEALKVLDESVPCVISTPERSDP